MSGVIKISRDSLAGIIKSLITSTRMVIDKQTLNPGASTTLFDKTVFYAVALIHGDGDSQTQLTITVGTDTTTLAGNEMAIVVAANEELKIDASNTDTANQHSTPTIEVLSISIG
jgi:hypothetical protein